MSQPWGGSSVPHNPSRPILPPITETSVVPSSDPRCIASVHRCSRTGRASERPGAEELGCRSDGAVAEPDGEVWRRRKDLVPILNLKVVQAGDHFCAEGIAVGRLAEDRNERNSSV